MINQYKSYVKNSKLLFNTCKYTIILYEKKHKYENYDTYRGLRFRRNEVLVNELVSFSAGCLNLSDPLSQS